MHAGSLLFVYGTLRRGEHADLSNRLEAEYVGEDRVNGQIFTASGWYPGYKGASAEKFNPSEPSVIGDVFRLKTDDIVKMLDAYEGYPSLYDRHETQTEGGHRVWIYVYQPDTTNMATIESGDWKHR